MWLSGPLHGRPSRGLSTLGLWARVGLTVIGGPASRKPGMGRAIGHLVKNCGALGWFLRYATIPPDNNVAEAGLRQAALGRSNCLFVGHEGATTWPSCTRLSRPARRRA